MSVGARLSLASGIAISEADIAGAAAIYLVPTGGSSVPVFDGTAFVGTPIGSGLSLALDGDSGHTGYHQAGKNFDLFLVDDSGAPRLATGPSWDIGGGSANARGVGSGSTEIEASEGFLVNKHPISARFGPGSSDVPTVAARHATYLGSFRAVGNGLVSDTCAQRLLFNAYNQTLRPLKVSETAQLWSYGAATWRPANGNSANRVEVLLGLAGGVVDLSINACAKGQSSSVRNVRIGIGLNGNSPSAGTTSINGVSNATTLMMHSSYRGSPGLGFHYFTWLELASGVENSTFFGTSPGTSDFNFGPSGLVYL